MGGDKAQVAADICVGCGMCVPLCRFDAIHVQDGAAVVSEFACEGCGVCVCACPAGAVALMPDVAGKRELYTKENVFSTAMLKMGRGNSGKLVTEVKLAMLKAAPPCDLAVVDGSPGIGCPVIASVSGMDLVLVIAEPSGSGVSDLKRLIQTAESFQTCLAVCVNRYDVSLDHTAEIEAFCAEQGIPFVGKVPYDPLAVKAVNAGMTVADIECPAGQAIREIYTAVLSLLGIQKSDK